MAPKVMGTSMFVIWFAGTFRSRIEGTDRAKDNGENQHCRESFDH